MGIVGGGCGGLSERSRNHAKTFKIGQKYGA